MLDIKLIRKDPEAIQKKLKTKDPKADLSLILDLDKRLREMKTKVEQLKASRNEYSQQIGEYKRTGKDAGEILKKVAEFADEIHSLDQQIPPVEEQYIHALASLPNLPMDDIKVSPDKEDNVLIKEFGKKPEFDFPFKNHLELND